MTHNPEYCNTSADIRARCLPARMHRADNRKWKSCPCRHDTALWIIQNEAVLTRELVRVFDAGIFKMNIGGGWSRFLTGKANKFRIHAFALLRTFIVDELRLSRADAHIIIGMWVGEILREEVEEVVALAPEPEMCENCGENPIAPEVKCGFEKWCVECDESLYSTRTPAPEPEVEDSLSRERNAFFASRDCASCRPCFDEGRDGCRACGFDLTSIERNAFFASRDCASCRPCFDEGRDECRACGLDLTYWVIDGDSALCDDEEQEIPWCYTDNKNAVCNCIQPCYPPSESESDEEEDEEPEVSPPV